VSKEKPSSDPFHHILCVFLIGKYLPWTEDGFRTSWGKAFEKTNLGDLHFHDLRGTAVTRLAPSNCTVPEIASITGHAMETVQAILDAHYLSGRLELAESAIKKLNAAYG